MKSNGLRLFLKLFLILTLPMSAVFGQGLFELNFPSSKHPFPNNMGSEKVNPGIATGSSSGLYMRFGEDIAKLCANYGIDLTSSDPNKYRYPKFRVNVYATQGGFDSVKRLRYEREVQLAIVQSDLRYFAQQRAKDVMDPKKRNAWEQIAEDIKLVLPLYKEKIHIVVRPEDKAKYRDLADLMKKGAVVNVGQVSSGGMLTCFMIEEIVKNSRNWPSGASWKPRFHSQGAALDLLLEKNPREPIEAVVLVGGVPYPALKNYGINYAVKKGLFKAGVEPKPELALLSVGEEIQEILATSPFRGYHRDMISIGEYEFMGDSNSSVDTVGVYSCLVTHDSYTSDSKTQKHKIEWVRHILFRILTKLDPNTEYGLPHDFGVPRVGNKWRDVQPVPELANGKESSFEELYGWPRHTDPILRSMVDLWSQGGGRGGRGPSTNVVDPITLF